MIWTSIESMELTISTKKRKCQACLGFIKQKENHLKLLMSLSCLELNGALSTIERKDVRIHHSCAKQMRLEKLLTKEKNLLNGHSQFLRRILNIKKSKKKKISKYQLISNG